MYVEMTFTRGTSAIFIVIFGPSRTRFEASNAAVTFPLQLLVCETMTTISGTDFQLLNAVSDSCAVPNDTVSIYYKAPSTDVEHTISVICTKLSRNTVGLNVFSINFAIMAEFGSEATDGAINARLTWCVASILLDPSGSACIGTPARTKASEERRREIIRLIA